MTSKTLRYLIAVCISLLFQCPALALPPVESDGNTPILAGANNVPLGGLYSHVMVWGDPGASGTNVTFNQVPATTSNAQIMNGAGVNYGLAGYSAAISSFNYYGNGTTGNLNWMAW